MLVVVDHFTKFHWAKEFKTKEAGPIAEYLFHIFTDGVCTPERWHADNGGEFKNYHIDAVRELLAARGHAQNTLLAYTHGMPRNPQCQGLVERANRSLKSLMHKNMEHAGYDSTKDKEYEWVPFLHNAVRLHNRTAVKMYGRMCPSELMNGCPPEAPDHQSLDPSELARLHLHCALQMRKKAAKREGRAPDEDSTNEDLEKDSHAAFKPNDIVLVQQNEKKSHADRQFKGAKKWTGRAIVVSQSATSHNHYQIQWISPGLVHREQAGTIAGDLWLAWRLKAAVRIASDPLTADTPVINATERHKKHRASASSRSSTAPAPFRGETTLRTREAEMTPNKLIQDLANRLSSTTHNTSSTAHIFRL